MNSKTFQPALKVFFALVLLAALLMPANPTSALPQKAAPAAVITPVNPNDAKYADGSQWNLNGTWGINAPMAWGITTGNASTVVAVLDTGITTHEDLTTSRVLNNPGGYDFVSDAANADDPGDYGVCGNSTWQGTHVAGIIGATSNNNTGVAGINWSAKILPVRVIGTCGSVTAGDVVAGMRWAAGLSVAGVPDNPVANRAKVIHVSASIPGQACTAYQADIDAITAAGTVIVTPAGDGNTTTNNFPANCNGVITVAATDALGYKADYSNYGAAVEISAPGGGNGQGFILSTVNAGTTTPESGSEYGNKSGTAMAAAHVSGVVSLMFAANPLITPAQVSAILQKTVRAFPTGTGACTTSICGWGILDGGEAVRVANMPDLIVTDVALSPNTPYFGQEFQAQVTVKNRGGLNLGGVDSIVALQVYVDRVPGTPDANGCIYLPDGSGDIDQGEFYRNQYLSTISSGSAITLPVKINNLSDPLQPANSWTDPLSSSYYDGVIADPLPWGEEGSHKLYVYADANCSLPESYEDNNAYSTYVWVNPYIEGALLYPRQGQNIGTDYNPTYKWNKVTGATKYHLYLGGPSGALTDQWFEASIVCGSGNTCSVELGPTLMLGGGTYGWYMQSYSPTTGYSAWSNNTQPTNFTVASPTLPGAATNLVPNSNIGTNYTPLLAWNKVTGATWYRVYMGGPGGVKVLDQWYQEANICNDTTCSVVSPLLGGGSYGWYVQTYGLAGYGPWSNNTQPIVFSTSTALPAAATNLLPNSNIGTNYTPTYTWDKITGATWYRLYVNGPTGLVLDTWYEASKICISTTCSVASPMLAGGTYGWYVQTYSPAGFGPWSNNTSPTYFSTSALSLGAAVNLVPNSDIGTNYTPTYTWDKVPGASWYRVKVNGPTGTALDQWYEMSKICNTTTCSVTSPLLGGGTYGWYVQTYGATGYGPWSNNMQPVIFTTSLTPPAAAVNLLPNSDIGTNYTPTYTWDKVTGATWYRIYVGFAGGTVLDQWYEASKICIDATCSVVSPLLGGGTYGWYVLTYSPAGYGTWSNNTQPTYFSTATAAPAATVLTDPTEGQNIGKEYNPIYRWSKVDGATWYRVYVDGPTGVVLDTWYPASTFCDAVVCSAVSPTLAGGAYVWYVQTYGPGGYGPWSNNMLPTHFNADIPTLPTAATNLSPTGTITGSAPLTFSWKKVPMAIWYRLYVKGATGVVKDQWYQSMNVCSGDVCSVPGIALANGDYTWWVQTYSSAGYGPWKSSTFKVRP